MTSRFKWPIYAEARSTLLAWASALANLDSLVAWKDEILAPVTGQWIPSYGAEAPMTYGAVTTTDAFYFKLFGLVYWRLDCNGTTATTGATMRILTATPPFRAMNKNHDGGGSIYYNGSEYGAKVRVVDNLIYVSRYDTAALAPVGAGTYIRAWGVYQATS